MIAKNKTIEYRNGIYFGQTFITAQKHQYRDGIGLLISDTGELVFGYWTKDLMNGKYYYSSGSSSAYGFMKEGMFEGWNVFNDADLTVWCQCRAGLFHGNVIIRMSNYEPEGYQFTLGEKVKQISLLNLSDPVKTLIASIQTNLELFIDTIVNDQKYKSNLGAIRLSNLTYYGAINYDIKSGEGLGFTISRSTLSSLGYFQKTLLHGLGRRFINGEIQDGVFAEGKLSGIIFKWNPKREQFTKHDYSTKEGIVLGRGNQYPIQQIQEMREQFHLRSMNFVNDCFIMEELIKVDLSSIKISRPQALKSRTQDLVQKLAKQYLDTTSSPMKSKSNSKKHQSLSYFRNVEKALTQTKIKVSQEEQSPEQVMKDHRLQNKLKASEFSPVYKTNLQMNDDNLEDAIKEYQELQRLKTTNRR